MRRSAPLRPTPAISVVLSVLNGERYLRNALDSILRQSFDDFEFIIIDDGSNDGTPQIVEEYAKADGRIRAFHQETKGLIVSLNRGCEMACGRYIARMDSDDIALPDRFERQIAFLEQHADVAALGGAVEFINAAGQGIGLSSNPVSHAEIRAALLDANVLWHPTVVIRRDGFFAVGGYRNVLSAEDYDLWLRIGDRFALANLPQAILKYRLHDGQITEKDNVQMTVSALAARGAAFARRSGMRDPLDGVHTITAATIVKLILNVRPVNLEDLRIGGTDAETLQIRSYFRWLLQAAQVGDECLHSAVLVLDSPYWRYAKRRYLGEACYTAARLHSMKGNFVPMVTAAAKATLNWPFILGRVFKPLRRALRRPAGYQAALLKAFQHPQSS